jgi:hypothetical protein
MLTNTYAKAETTTKYDNGFASLKYSSWPSFDRVSNVIVIKC